jgi:hypothetical protein
MAYTGRGPANAPITSADINDGIISSSDIQDSAITTAKIADGDITSAKMDSNITISGTMTASNFDSSSDVALKYNLEKVTNPLEKLKGISGYTFNWKSNDGESVGVIAQEVEKIFPQLVRTAEDGNKKVNYDALVPVLIEAIKELNKKIESK